MHTLTWEGKRRFTARTPDGREGRFDTPAEYGGEGTAPTPMEAVLHALAGCAAVDVVAILEKMRLPLEGLRVEIDADRAEDHPRVYTAIRLRFVAKGDLPLKKVERAVKMSAETFCSVSAMLKPKVEITYEVVVEP